MRRRRPRPMPLETSRCPYCHLLYPHRPGTRPSNCGHPECRAEDSRQLRLGGEPDAAHSDHD